MLWDVLFLKPAVCASLFLNGHYTDNNVLLVGVNLNLCKNSWLKSYRNPGNVKNTADQKIALGIFILQVAQCIYVRRIDQYKEEWEDDSIIDIKLLKQIDFNQQAEGFNKFKFYFELFKIKAVEGPVR